MLFYYSETWKSDRYCNYIGSAIPAVFTLHVLEITSCFIGEASQALVSEAQQITTRICFNFLLLFYNLMNSNLYCFVFFSPGHVKESWIMQSCVVSVLTQRDAQGVIFIRSCSQQASLQRFCVAAQLLKGLYETWTLNMICIINVCDRERMNLEGAV